MTDATSGRPRPQRSGLRVGPLVVGDLLGAGGMGEVYRAAQEDLGREVAIKFISPEGYGDPVNRKRFLREIKACTSLKHPSVVRIYDWGEIEGDIYFVMEYVSGRSLGDILEERGRLSMEEGLQIGEDLLSALASMHPAGFIHRDIKPANVMITSHGRTVLMDFGLVKITTEESFTVAGKVLGTPRYMPPEMLAGGVSDGRGDLYQTALILYECFSGAQPWTPTDFLRFLRGDLKPRPIPLSKYDPSLALPLEQWLANALQPQPEARYADAQTMLSDLVRVREGRPVPPATERPASARAAVTRSGITTNGDLESVLGPLTQVASDPWGALVAGEGPEGPAWIRIVPGRLLESADRRALTADLEALGAMAAPLLACPRAVQVLGGAFLIVFSPGPGRALKDHATPMAPAAAAALVRDVVAALAPLHATGVGHGFVDPRSVRIEGGRLAQIWDLEAHVLARHTPVLLVKDSTLRLSTFTAPEVLDGNPPTPASDVFSLGRLLVRLVTGRVPAYDGSLPANLPGPLASLIQRATAPLAERLADPAALARALDRHAAPLRGRGAGPVSVGGPAPAPGGGRSVALAAGIVALALAAALVSWSSMVRPDPRAFDPQGVSIWAGPREVQLRFRTQVAWAAALEYGPSPDRMRIAREERPSTEHSFSLTALTPGTRYLWRILRPDGTTGPSQSFATEPVAVGAFTEELRPRAIRLRFRTNVPASLSVEYALSEGPSRTEVVGPEPQPLLNHEFELPTAVFGPPMKVKVLAADTEGGLSVVHQRAIDSLETRVARIERRIRREWLASVVVRLREHAGGKGSVQERTREMHRVVAPVARAIDELLGLARPVLDSTELAPPLKLRVYALCAVLSELDAACQALDVPYASGVRTVYPSSFRMNRSALFEPDRKLVLPFKDPQKGFIPATTPRFDGLEQVVLSARGKREDTVTFEFTEPRPPRRVSVFVPVRLLEWMYGKDNLFHVGVNGQVDLVCRYERADYERSRESRQPLPGLHHSFDPRLIRQGRNQLTLKVVPIPGIGNTMGMTTIPSIEVWLEKGRE